MGFFNKIKDLFTDEIEEVEPIKKEVIQVEIATPKQENKEEKANISDSKVIKKIEKNPAPVFFSDSDFEDLRYSSTNREKKQQRSNYSYKQNNQKKNKEEEKPKVFKPTPIISPVYGILDKNYSKDDISVKPVTKTEPQSSTKELSIDLVRKKAFGTLEEELETELFNTNSILFKQEIEEVEEKDLFEELKNKEQETIHNNDEGDILEELNLSDLTIDDINDNDDPIDELESDQNMLVEELVQMFEEDDDKLTEGDLFELIDSMYEKEDDIND